MPDQITDPDAEQMARFRQMMVDAEGLRSTVYKDSLGYLSVGIGHKVVSKDKLAAGQTVSPERIEELFHQDASLALGRARSQAAQAGITDSTFIPPLASVNFQLGRKWPDSFPRAWGAMGAGDYQTAAMEAARSNWMLQTPKRVRAFQDALLALKPKTTDPDE